MERLPTSERHESMRGYFAHELHYQMQKNKNIMVVSIDLGYGMFDKIKRDFPRRFINTGAAEQTALGISVGLAEEGKIPFVYSITPFLLFRGFETIRNYIDHESVPVKLVGGGRDWDYAHDGFSHYAGDDLQFLQHFENINIFYPTSKEDTPKLLDYMVKLKKPCYMNLSR